MESMLQPKSPPTFHPSSSSASPSSAARTTSCRTSSPISPAPRGRATKPREFENLILENLDVVLEALEIPRNIVLSAGPYHQRGTQRRTGCQIDLLIQSKRSLYVCEMKFRRQIDASVIQEVDKKVQALNLPKSQSIRTALIYDGQLATSIEEEQAFDFLVPTSALFAS